MRLESVPLDGKAGVRACDVIQMNAGLHGNLLSQGMRTARSREDNEIGNPESAFPVIVRYE